MLVVLARASAPEISIREWMPITRFLVDTATRHRQGAVLAAETELRQLALLCLPRTA